MRRPIVGRRPLVFAILATLAIVGTAGLSGLEGSVHARPPSILLEVPADAFRRVTIPADSDPADSDPADSDSADSDPADSDPADSDPADGETLRGVARRPDGGATEPPVETTPAPPTPRPSPPAGPVHVVRPGDTLIQIAAWHRVELTPIVTWNPTADPRRLVSGQRILVPAGAPMPVVAPAPTSAPVVAPAPTSAPVVAPAPTSAPPDSSAAPAPTSAAPAAAASDHLWPLPVKGILTRRFSSAHPGIDIAAPAGTPVRAIAGGTVVWAGWKTNGGGYVVVIEHPDGMTSTYNHNQGVDVSARQVVAAGEVISRVGATGWATGPHLDLRIEMGGRLMDPLRLGWAR